MFILKYTADTDSYKNNSPLQQYCIIFKFKYNFCYDKSKLTANGNIGYPPPPRIYANEYTY